MVRVWKTILLVGAALLIIANPPLGAAVIYGALIVRWSRPDALTGRARVVRSGPEGPKCC